MIALNTKRQTATGYAPATVANVAVGFDILGFPVEALGDTVILTKRADKKIVIEEIIGPDPLPQNPEKNTATIALQSIIKELNLAVGFNVILKKGIPISSGMGGSAASAVAALLALNQFLISPLSKKELAPFALYAESIISGSVHGDNVIPCLYNKFSLIQSIDPLVIIFLPVPNIYYVLVHPHLQIETKRARQILPETFPLNLITQQSANLAAFISALYQNNLGLMRLSLQDILIEPIRSSLIKNFSAVKNAALQKNALGCSLAGSGPSIFSFSETEEQAKIILASMIEPFKNSGVKTDAWIEKLK